MDRDFYIEKFGLVYLHGSIASLTGKGCSWVWEKSILLASSEYLLTFSDPDHTFVLPECLSEYVWYVFPCFFFSHNFFTACLSQSTKPEIPSTHIYFDSSRCQALIAKQQYQISSSMLHFLFVLHNLITAICKRVGALINEPLSGNLSQKVTPVSPKAASKLPYLVQMKKFEIYL